MNNVIFSLLFITIDYIIILLFAGHVIGCKSRDFRLPIVMLLIYVLGLNAIFIWWPVTITYDMILVVFCLLCRILAVKWIFPSFKFRYYLVFQLFLTCYTDLALHLVYLIWDVCIDWMVIVYLVVYVICLGVLLSPIRHLFRQIYLHTPTYVLWITAISLTVSIDLIEYVGILYIESPNDSLKKTFLAVTLVTTAGLSIMFPAVMFVSSINKRLRGLAANYEAQIQAQATHYQTLAASNFEIRRFRHDYKNTRIAIEQLLSDGQTEQALQVLRDCEDSLRHPNILFDTGNGIADALLTDKQRLAVRQYADIHFRGSIPSNVLAPTDVCVLLGNTLDNAIEACAKLTHDEKHIISVTCDCSSGFLFLTIKNPIQDRVIIQNNQVMTTKEDKAAHGFGIQSLHTVAKKYSGTVKLNADDGYFTVTTDLCLPTK